MKFLKGLLKTVTAIIAVVLCIIIFALEIGLHIVVNTRGFVSKDSISTMIKNIDINELMIVIDDNDIITGFEETGIEEEAIKEILNSNSMKTVIGNYFGSSIDSVLYNTAVQKPTVDDIVNIIEENYEIIAQHARNNGETVDDDFKSELMAEARATAPKLIDELPVLSEELILEDSEVFEAVDIIQKILDIRNFILGIATVVILVGVIALIRWNLYSWMMWLSIPTIISGFISLLISFSSIVINFLFKSSELSLSAVDFIRKEILGGLFTRFMISGIIAIVLGIVLIIAYNLINKVHKKKNNPDLFEAAHEPAKIEYSTPVNESIYDEVPKKDNELQE